MGALLSVVREIPWLLGITDSVDLAGTWQSYSASHHGKKDVYVGVVSQHPSPAMDGDHHRRRSLAARPTTRIYRREATQSGA